MFMDKSQRRLPNSREVLIKVRTRCYHYNLIYYLNESSVIPLIMACASKYIYFSKLRCDLLERVTVASEFDVAVFLPHYDAMSNDAEMESGYGSVAVPEYLVCPVCQDVLKDPRILACSHTVCRQCLKDDHCEDDVSSDDSSPGGLACPLCSKRSNASSPDECPHNRAIADAVEHWRLHSIRRGQCIQLLASVAAAKDRMQQDNESVPFRFNHDVSSQGKNNGTKSAGVRERLKTSLDTFAKVDDVCLLLHTINLGHLEVLSVHCKYVDNLSKLQMHMQELLSIKFVAMRAKVKAHFADAMEPIETCRKSALRLTRELSKHLSMAEGVVDDNIELFLQTDKDLALAVERFVDNYNKQTRDAVESFKTHLYNTVIDMETVKNSLSNWDTRSSIQTETVQVQPHTISNKFDDDSNGQNGCDEEGRLTASTALSNGSSTDISTFSKEASSSSCKSSATDNAQQESLPLQSRLVEAQTLDPTDTSKQEENLEPFRNRETTEGDSSPDWLLEPPMWMMASYDTTDGRSADEEAIQDAVRLTSPQSVPAGGRYFCPIAVPDISPSSNDRPSCNVVDCTRQSERTNLAHTESTPSETLTEDELLSGYMSLRNSAYQTDPISETQQDSNSNVQYNFADTVPWTSSDNPGSNGDVKTSADPQTRLSENQQIPVLSAIDSITVLASHLRKLRRPEASMSLPSRREWEQHEGAGEPYFAVDTNGGSGSGLGRSRHTTVRFADSQKRILQRDRLGEPMCSQVII